MEKVDIVDENLKVLYQTTKQHAHDNGLLHPTVIAEVVNSKGEWLLVKQASHKQDPGQFVSPVGGHIGSGESHENALKREAEEEIGLNGEIEHEYVDRKIYVRKWEKGSENHFFIVYKIYSDKNPVLNDESVEYRWLKTDEIKKLLKENPNMFGYAFHFVVKNFFSKLFLD
ncbi:MAG: NUDIX hydrolase [Patescibacteria group bacterium]